MSDQDAPERSESNDQQMTEEEILDRLKKADALLDQYKELLEPVLKDLASKKSIIAFGVDGLYDGHFGCYEEGIDSLCLHITDAGVAHMEEFKEGVEKGRDFQDAWWHRAMEAGVNNILIGGHH